MRYPLFFALIVSAAGAAAEPADKPAGPADASVRVPAIKYESAFAGYRPLHTEALIPWKAANDEVGRIGGWRVYAREAREPDPAAAAALPANAPDSKSSPDAAPRQAPGDHVGHKMN
jgi:hypothetical protein